MLNFTDEYKNYKWFKELDFSKELLSLREIDGLKDTFVPKIALIGEFSAGKSSIINNMLNEKILPVGWQPETKYITEIKYSNENYIFVDNEKIELSTENIKNLKTNSDKVEIFMNNPILKEVTFIDTPGTNDPTTFNDNIVFDVVSNSDLVMFITKANQALSNSERLFLSKVIKAKDLEKFFFIINFADVVDNRKMVKNEFINNLSLLLTLDKEIITNQTLLYSVKEKEIYDYVLEYLLEFIHKKRDKLLIDWEKSEKEKVLNQMLLKVEILLDSLDGKVSTYDEELQKIDKEIKLFEQSITSELNKLNSKLENLKSNTIQNIESGINSIKKEIEQEINEMDYNQLVTTRYTELRVKKLVEDLVESEWRNFVKSMAKLVDNFDKEIDNNVINSLSLPTLKNTKSKKIVNTTAIATVGMGAVAALPVAEGVMGAGAILGGLGGIAPILGMIPGIGGVLGVIGTVASIAVPIVGAFVLSAGKILFDVTKWGVSKAGDLAQIAEEKMYKKKYTSEINKQLDKLSTKIVSQIKMINFDEFKDKYIETKFPQKRLLEEKIKLLQNKKIDKQEDIQKEKNEILKFYYEIEEMKNEL
jgi:hypothetical protein